MANKYRGEVGFKVGDDEYTLRFSANALIRIEEEFELKGISQIGEIMGEDMSMKSLRTLFGIGLGDRHPDLKLDDVGEIMTEVGITEAAELLGKAMEAAFPKVEAGKAIPAGKTPK